MSERKDTRKDLVVGGAALLAAAASAPALIAAAAGTLVAVGWNKLSNKAQVRAQRVLERMVDGDDDPHAFASHVQQRLEDGDEEAFAAFRALLTNAIEANSAEALAPMGFVGRAYFTKRCTVQHARAAIELFNYATSAELQHMRRLADEAARLDGKYITVVADMPPRANGENRGWRAWADGVPDSDETIRMTPFPDAIAVFAQLKRVGLGTDSGGFGIGGSPLAIQMSSDAVRLLRDALATLAVT